MNTQKNPTNNSSEAGDPMDGLRLFDPDKDPSLANPFLIKTPEDLAKLASLVNNGTTYDHEETPTLYAAADYRLINDLDLDPTSTGYTHTPIGGGEFPSHPDHTPFTGTFDGNGKTLSNLSYHKSHSALGLFSWIKDAKIFNLTLKDPSMKNTSTNENNTTGALVGVADGNSDLSNVRVIGGTIQGQYRVGGLVGIQYSGSTITASYWDTQTTGQTSSAGGGTGYRTAQLQVLRTSTNLYATWTTPPCPIPVATTRPELSWEPLLALVSSPMLASLEEP